MRAPRRDAADAVHADRVRERASGHSLWRGDLSKSSRESDQISCSRDWFRFVRILHMCSLQNLCMSHFTTHRARSDLGTSLREPLAHTTRNMRIAQIVRLVRSGATGTILTAHALSSGSHISTRTPALSARRRRAPSSPRVRCILARIPLATSGPPQEAAPARQMTTGIHASQSSA